MDKTEQVVGQHSRTESWTIRSLVKSRRPVGRGPRVLRTDRRVSIVEEGGGPTEGKMGDRGFSETQVKGEPHPNLTYVLVST